MRVALILIAAALLFAYRFMLPWTPLWLDLLVGLAAGVGALVAFSSNSGK